VLSNRFCGAGVLLTVWFGNVQVWGSKPLRFNWFCGAGVLLTVWFGNVQVWGRKPLLLNWFCGAGVLLTVWFGNVFREVSEESQCFLTGSVVQGCC
jgi:hypothetical protein